MKLKELKTKVDSLMRNHAEDDVRLLIAKPSMGPRASVSIDGIQAGFDWEQGSILMHSSKRITVKSSKEEVYDMSFDLLHTLFEYGHSLKRKPWWYDHIYRIYEKTGKLETMIRLAEGKLGRGKNESS